MALYENQKVTRGLFSMEEYSMANESEMVTPEHLLETAIEAKSTPAIKLRAARSKQSNSEEVRDVSNAKESKQTKRVTKRTRGGGSLDILRLIDARVAQGTSLKDAIEESGVSKQSYYRWKKIGTSSATKLTAVVLSDASPAPLGDELADLIELDAENQRLRSLLAEKLRTENAELRKRLGIQ